MVPIVSRMSIRKPRSIRRSVGPARDEYQSPHQRRITRGGSGGDDRAERVTQQVDRRGRRVTNRARDLLDQGIQRQRPGGNGRVSATTEVRRDHTSPIGEPVHDMTEVRPPVRARAVHEDKARAGTGRCVANLGTSHRDRRHSLLPLPRRFTRSAGRPPGP